MIHATYQHCIWADKSDVYEIHHGATIQNIVESLSLPPEFATYGGIFLRGSEHEQGHLVDREYWHRIKPKDGTHLYISLIPQGGGGSSGSSGKSVFMIVAAIALIAITTLVSGGALSFLAPSLLAAGSTGAYVAAAAIGVAGSAALSLLSKPAAGAQQAGSTDIAAGPSPGIAGISQNPIGAYSQLTAVRGSIRVSPPLLARPFTTIEGNDQVLHMIVGVCGPQDVSAIKINETDIADLPDGVLEYETREGWLDDDSLTLITESGFEENLNLQMSTHRLNTDNTTLIEPYTGSYPKAHIFRSARRTNRFRILLTFPSGLSFYNSGSEVAVAFRIRIRRLGDVSWINLPEFHINASKREAFRQEIWLMWGSDEDEDAIQEEVAGESSYFKRVYNRNPEWTSDSYFDAGAVGATDSNVKRVYRGTDEIFFHLDDGVFPVGQYDVEITRGFADDHSNYDDTSYPSPSGLFTFRTAGPPHSIVDQSSVSASCVISSHCSFRDEYPIVRRGMAMIALKIRNLQVNSVSAIFGSYVNVWNGVGWDDVEVSSNPASLLRDALIGRLNARPVNVARLEDDLTEFYDYCEDTGLTCNHVVTEGSVEQIATLIANCGDSVLRRSDFWGVVTDRDRSAEPHVGVFQPDNMTSPLVIQKNFVTSARALIPSFRDETQDFANTELTEPVYDDGVPSTDETLTEATSYDGLTTEALVRRRAKLDLRRARLRTNKYTWGVHLSHLKAKKGTIVGLAHDVLIDTYATGRVLSLVKSGLNLKSIRLNNNVEDAPVVNFDNLFDVDNILTLGNIFSLTGPKIGVQIELEDANIVTIPISGVSGSTLTVEGSFAFPAALKRGLLAAVGLRDRETRRVLLVDVNPKNDFFASIDAIDEAPRIFEGL